MQIWTLTLIIAVDAAIPAAAVKRASGEIASHAQRDKCCVMVIALMSCMTHADAETATLFVAKISTAVTAFVGISRLTSRAAAGVDVDAVPVRPAFRGRAYRHARLDKRGVTKGA